MAVVLESDQLAFTLVVKDDGPGVLPAELPRLGEGRSGPMKLGNAIRPEADSASQSPARSAAYVRGNYVRTRKPARPLCWHRRPGHRGAGVIAGPDRRSLPPWRLRDHMAKVLEWTAKPSNGHSSGVFEIGPSGPRPSRDLPRDARALDSRRATASCATTRWRGRSSRAPRSSIDVCRGAPRAEIRWILSADQSPHHSTMCSAFAPVKTRETRKYVLSAIV